MKKYSNHIRSLIVAIVASKFYIDKNKKNKNNKKYNFAIFI